MKRGIVSFDFDNTLSKPVVQDFCHSLMDNFDVYIVTARYSTEYASNEFGIYNSNDDLYEVAISLDIPKRNIVFTNGDIKVDYLKSLPVKPLFHLDDSRMEIEAINNDGTVKGIHLYMYRISNLILDCINALGNYHNYSAKGVHKSLGAFDTDYCNKVELPEIYKDSCKYQCRMCMLMSSAKFRLKVNKKLKSTKINLNE